MKEISSRVIQETPDAMANRLINQAEYRDGLQEMAIGAVVLTFAGVMAFWMVYTGSLLFKELLLLLLPLVALVCQGVIKLVRKRFLLGKAGYVRLKPMNRKQVGILMGKTIVRSVFFAALFSLAIFCLGMYAHRRWGAAYLRTLPLGSWMLGLNGIVLGAIMIWRGRLPRYRIGGVALMVLGILIGLSGVTTFVGWMILGGCAGLLPIIAGSVVFLRYLRQPAEIGE